jgi:transcriptional regulator with XRE-family HTH domain
MTDKDVLRALGRSINQRRKLLRLSEQQLAAVVGVSENRIRRIEQGQHNPTVVLLAKIAAALRTRVSALFPSR